MADVENVVLLSVDALRPDHLSCSGYDRPTSPRIDRFAGECVVFERAFSASSHTREAIPALLTGQYPDEAVDGSYHLDAPTVAGYLGERGGVTAAFHSNPFVSRAYGFGRDFDVFSDDMRLGQQKFVVLLQRILDKLRNRHYAQAGTINRRALAWVDSVGEPFFVWNHYMDVHGPYQPPEQYQREFGEGAMSLKSAQKLYKRAIRDPDSISADERQRLIDLYDGEIRYLDEQIGELLTELDRRNLLANTLILFTADHGDAFGERGYYEHPRQLDDELVRVPLLFRHPGIEPERLSTVASALDIVPTILAAVGIDRPSLPGRSLLEVRSRPEDFDDRVVFIQARGEGDDAELVRFAARDGDGGCSLTRHVRSMEVEAEAVVGADEDLADRLRAHSLSRIRRRSRAAAEQPPDDEPVDGAIEDRLHALGYRE